MGARGVDARRKIFERVDRGRQGDGDAAVALHDRLEREAVDVVDLSGRQRLAGLGDLIAGRQNGDGRPLEHLDAGGARGGERADAARV